MSALLDYDTGPLNWVRGDIDAALHAALGRVQAYSVDADLTNALRLARDDAHQVAGALRMVGLEGAAMLAGALETSLTELDANHLQPSEAVLQALRNAIEGLQRWVRDMANGRGSGELALFPLYKRLRELQGAERVFEGELFFPDMRTRMSARPDNETLTQDALAASVRVARGQFQRGLLAFLRNTDAEQGLQRMRDALASIESIAPSQASQTFWWACVGFVDSLIAHGVEADFHVKQLLARVDLQMRRLMEGSPQVAERLMRDALFFVAKSKTLDGRAAEVRTALGLDRYLPGRGMLDPEALVNMRPALEALKTGLKAARDTWQAYVEGHADQSVQFHSQLVQLQPSAQIFERSQLAPLMNRVVAAAGVASEREGDAREQINLEVAATLLLMQKAVDQEEILHEEFAARSADQQARLSALIDGRELPESVMDASSQREAERDMLVHMAQEVGQNLQQMEETLDAFFRDGSEREALAGLSELAQQAQGALSMLELPEAASLLRAATDIMQPFASEGHPDDATQQRLADAFSSLGLFIDAYCAGRADAGRILRPVLIDFGVIADDGPDETVFDDTIEAGLPGRKAEVHATYLEWRDTSDEGAKKKYFDALTELGHDAELIDDAPLKQQTRAAFDLSRDAVGAPRALDAVIARLCGLDMPDRTEAEPLASQVRGAPGAVEPAAPKAVATVPGDRVEAAESLAEASNSIPAETAVAEVGAVIEVAQPVFGAVMEIAQPLATAPDGSPPAGTLLATIPEGVEPELLDIFLEEANDVLATLTRAGEDSQSDPDDQAGLAVIRRGFHTLKGSGRMVGLNDLGETAWRLEQLMNGWLSEKKPASSDLLHLIERACGVFHHWVSALQASQPVALPVAELLEAVDRVAQDQALDASPAESASEWAMPSEPDDTPVVEIEADTEVGLETHADPVAADASDVDAKVGGDLISVVSDVDTPESDVATFIYGTPVLEVGAIIEYAVGVKAPDEICIGSICISTGLYDIFMVESKQRLLVLEEESERLADAPDTPVCEHARRAVHTLAGIAGTAGIAVLADLAHALEQYWNRFAQTPLPVAHLPLVQESVARLHDMVSDIGSGHLPVAAQDLVATLGELEDEQAAPSVGTNVPLADEDADEGALPVSEPSVEPTVEAASVETFDEPEPVEIQSEVVVAPIPLDVSALIAGIKPSTPLPVFERREVNDELDPELLSLFLDEADTLVPETSAHLRGWKAAPDETAARDALRRDLHTIKGSARMVGAMRLGELTHIMESRVIAVIDGHLSATAEVFDTLEAQLDRLADSVEHLKQHHVMPVDVDAPAPLEAPVEPVLPSAPATHAVVDPLTPAQPITRDSNALSLRVRADWVDRMVNQAGEVAIARSRIESEMFAFKRHVGELSDALVRLRGHIREVEIQAESQMQATFHTEGVAEKFDPLEFDRFTRFQEVTRFLAESVNDISTVQHILLARLGESDAALLHQTRLNRELQQDLLRVRMVPLYSVAERLYRTVRQTARDVNKSAQLDIQGGDLEIDRSVLEKVTAPLEHLLRNALAHGIETPEVRRAAGKSEFGEIVLSARQSGNEMLLSVKDDGAGLNFARIREKAEASGLLLPGVEPTETLLAQMILAAGFSTAETVSQVAGRGVGMDVVKSEISTLGGRVDITSTTGAGTCFNIYLPLTLAMTQAVMVQAAKHDYALPAPLVQQVLELKPDELAQAMATGEVTWRGGRYPLTYLPHLLGDSEAVHEVQHYNPVLLLASGSSLAAVLVDVIEGTREIVVKNIGPQMARITGVVGATVRGDGRVILILNPVPLALRWTSLPRTEATQAVPAVGLEAAPASQPPLVLVVDDSLTVRKITTRLLLREGFRVDSAKDGVDALEKMNDLLPDMVLLDVEMPRMDGFELARVMRSDPRLKPVPIIMITSRTADKHRKHAQEIGVNVYLGKPYQEQQLLEHIAEQLRHATPHGLQPVVDRSPSGHESAVPA
ncbi:MAG: Hpt domain-containing protein [Thiobacillus sp.]